jgi:hypothetical protein
MAIHELFGLPVTVAEICPRCGVYVHDIHLCNAPKVTMCGGYRAGKTLSRALGEMMRAAVLKMEKERRV